MDKKIFYIIVFLSVLVVAMLSWYIFNSQAKVFLKSESNGYVSSSFHLTMNPSTVSLSGNVTPSVSGLSNLNGKLVYFKKENCLGPISENVKAAYSLDENSGTVAHDYSDNNNSGNIYGASWALGRFGSALYFDDTNHYVDIGNSSNLNFGPGQDFSISAWIRSDDISNLKEWGHTIVSIGTGQEDVNGKYEKDRATLTIVGTKFETEGGWKNAVGRPLFFSYGQWQVLGDSMFPRIDDEKWHHIVAVADRDGNAVIYVDDIPVGQADIREYYNISYGLVGNDTIGGTSGWEPFFGVIDEVGIYNKALTPEDVNALYDERTCILSDGECTADTFTAPINPGNHTYYACLENDDYKYNEQYSKNLTVSESPFDSSLVGYWKLDEGSGIDVVDSSGNGKNGVIVNPSGAIWTNECNHKNCLYFNGKDGYVDIPNQFQFSQITLEASIYPFDCGTLNKTDNSHSSSTPLTVSVYPSGNVYFEYRNDCRFEFNLYDSVGKWHSVGTTLDPGLWYNVIGTFDGTNQKLYVNGRLVSSGVSSGMKLDNTDIRIGTGIPDSTTYEGNFNGKIDEVKIYNRALSSDEIPQYYNYPFIYPLGLPYDPESRTNLPIMSKFEQKILSPFYLKRSYDWPYSKWVSYYPIPRGTISFDEEGLIFTSSSNMWLISRTDYLEQVNVSWVWKPLDGDQFITEAWINKKATGNEKLAPDVNPDKGVGLTCMIIFEPTGIYYSKADETDFKKQLSTVDLTKSKSWIYVNAIVDYRDSVKKIKSLFITNSSFSQTWTDLPIGYEPTGSDVSWFQPQIWTSESKSSAFKVKQINVNPTMG
jgi:hypothetical protein